MMPPSIHDFNEAYGDLIIRCRDHGEAELTVSQEKEFKTGDKMGRCPVCGGIPQQIRRKSFVPPRE
jgi:hypothetical protein